ncbi:unnamed protein product [Arabis nemorensis]|uniref:peptidylprolyl isomerase n=1 Tax=Arabis nemorensis TaxID=586526 RepID=A0A565AT78_9BRAS|nr:unnamed protein product [Arabis nemorensis]
MGFWGVEVKPGKPQPFCPQSEQGKLHVTQATLGAGLGKEKSVIQCSIGDKAPIYLCSLLPNKIESCPLNLEFDDEDETVEFSVTGDRSIHLSGFLEEYREDYEQEEEDDDSYPFVVISRLNKLYSLGFHYDNIRDGIDIGDSGSEESSAYDSEEEDHMDELEDFLDTNLDIYRRRSSVPNSGVVIEEIEDEEKPAEENKTKRPKKKGQATEDENAKKQIIAKETANVPVLESEDEDGLPISKEAREPESKTAEKMDLDDNLSNKKRKANASVQDVVQERTESSKTPDRSAEKKTKKKKNNSSEEATVKSKAITSSVEKPKSVSISEGKQVNTKSSHVRTYPNGLIVEELDMGKPNAKKASPGDQVSVRYIGKLQKNGKIFDSNIGKAPFKFRLGLGQVIKGWDVGVNGMRVGDKRKLTIPPSMGYGERGAGGQIPPNAWLVFDVELIDVKPTRS